MGGRFWQIWSVSGDEEGGRGWNLQSISSACEHSFADHSLMHTDHNSHGNCCPSPNSQDTFPQHPPTHPPMANFFFLFLIIKNEIKRIYSPRCIHGHETHPHFIWSPMWFFKYKNQTKIFEIPWVCCGRVGALAIEGGTAVAMAIVSNPIMSDHQTHVCPTKGAFTLGVRDSSVESIITILVT
jgi:hypothetical protein